MRIATHNAGYGASTTYGERTMTTTATDDLPITTSEDDDFLAAFIAIVRENELRERALARRSA